MRYFITVFNNILKFTPYTHAHFKLFIDRIIYTLTHIILSLIPSLVTLEWSSCKDDRLVIRRPCCLGGSNPTVDKIFCNVHLFRVPLRWTGSVQMKSSMKFIRDHRCI